MRETADLVVIGGGIQGCSAALHAALRGLSVIVIEKDTVARHASGVNAGGVRRLGRHYAEIPISQRSMEIWNRIERPARRRLRFPARAADQGCRNRGGAGKAEGPRRRRPLARVRPRGHPRPGGAPRPSSRRCKPLRRRARQSGGWLRAALPDDLRLPAQGNVARRALP